MTTRRSFLRNLIAAVVLAPVVAKFAEALPAAEFDKPHWRAVFEMASRPVHPKFGYAVLLKRAPDDNSVVLT